MPPSISEQGKQSFMWANEEMVSAFVCHSIPNIQAGLQQKLCTGGTCLRNPAVWEPTLLSSHPTHQLIRSFLIHSILQATLQYICSARHSLMLINPVSYLLLVEKRLKVIVAHVIQQI